MGPLTILILLLPWIPSTVSGAEQSGYRKESGLFVGTPSAAVQAASRTVCARQCMVTEAVCCSGFTYHSNNGSCRLFSYNETCVDPTRPPPAADDSGGPSSYRLLPCNGTCPQQCESPSASNTSTCSASLYSLYFDQATGRCHYEENTKCTTTGVPTTEQPTTAEPTTAEPSTAQPTTGQPTTAEPTTAEPTTEEPTTAEPTTSEPTTAEPSTAQPTTGQPTTAEPTTTEPTTAEPTTAEPTTAEPSTAQPATTALIVAESIASNQCAETSFTCPTDTTQFHFAKEDNCRQFYKCSNGCPFVFGCPAPLSYNPAIFICDWDASTGCTAPPL